MVLPPTLKKSSRLPPVRVRGLLPAGLVDELLQSCLDLVVREERHVARVGHCQAVPVPQQRGPRLGGGGGHRDTPKASCLGPPVTPHPNPDIKADVAAPAHPPLISITEHPVLPAPNIAPSHHAWNKDAIEDCARRHVPGSPHQTRHLKSARALTGISNRPLPEVESQRSGTGRRSPQLAHR